MRTDKGLSLPAKLPRDRHGELVGRGRDAWAPDGRADEALMRAMRTGINLTVETRAANGARFRDVYQLRGAASAIDAAALACLPPR